MDSMVDVFGADGILNLNGNAYAVEFELNYHGVNGTLWRTDYDEIDNPDADFESRAFSMNAINNYYSLTSDDWTDGSIDDAAYSASISGDKFMILNVLASIGVQTAIDKLDAINEILNA